MASKPEINKKAICIYPQIDVEMPLLSFREDFCEVFSPGVVYDFEIRSEWNDKIMITTLTVEELQMLYAAIGNPLKLREKDPRRQGWDAFE